MVLGAFGQKPSKPLPPLPSPPTFGAWYGGWLKRCLLDLEDRGAVSRAEVGTMTLLSVNRDRGGADWIGPAPIRGPSIFRELSIRA